MKEEEMQEKAIGFRNEVVKLKVQNYSDELNAFNNMLDESLYDKNWWKFIRTNVYLIREIRPVYRFGIPWPVRRRMGTGQQLPERDDDLRQFYKNTNWPEGIWTNEEVDNYALYCRELVGALGFVSYDPEMGIRRTPRNTDIDLNFT